MKEWGVIWFKWLSTIFQSMSCIYQFSHYGLYCQQHCTHWICHYKARISPMLPALGWFWPRSGTLWHVEREKCLFLLLAYRFFGIPFAKVLTLCLPEENCACGTTAGKCDCGEGCTCAKCPAKTAAKETTGRYQRLTEPISVNSLCLVNLV